MTATTAIPGLESNPRPPVTGPLEIPPAPPGHAFRWRRVLKLLRDVRTADDQVAAGLALFDAVGGMDSERTFQRFVRHPEGRRMLRTLPDLVDRLGDRKALAAMPEGSLGRAYLEFAEKNGFAADGLVQKNREVKREVDSIDPYRRWFWDRFSVAHDLWHVLTGCPTSPEGESELLWFSYGHNPGRGMLVLVGLVTYSSGTDLRRHRIHYRAWRAGRRAENLLLARWEDFLEWPLDEVRACFRVPELV